MSNAAKPWVFRILAAILGVAATAVAGIKADAVHFGIIYPLVMTAQVFALAWLGKFVREYGSSNV